MLLKTPWMDHKHWRVAFEPFANNSRTVSSYTRLGAESLKVVQDLPSQNVIDYTIPCNEA